MKPAWIYAGLLILLLAAGAVRATTYRWVDEQGRVHYGDVIPPQQAGLGSVELDTQGRIKRENPRTRLTPEESRRMEEKNRQAEHARKQEQEQRRRDRSLLSTYVSEAEINLARDRAVEQEMSALHGLRTRLKAAAGKLDQANRYLASQPAGNTKAYMQMREEAMAEHTRLSEMLRQREQALEDTRVRFEADRLRFQELRNAMAR